MIEIDWTKPIQGAISKYPARLVCSDAGGRNPYVCLIKTTDGTESPISVDRYGRQGNGGPYIANVPPPKKTIYVYGWKSRLGPHETWQYVCRDQKIEVSPEGIHPANGLQYRLIETLSVDI